MSAYDFTIVGTGLFGAVFANEAMKHGKKVLMVEKRDHIGGNIYTEKRDGIDIHRYGAHIFHTSDKEVWDYMNSLVAFRPFINSPIASYHGLPAPPKAQGSRRVSVPWARNSGRKAAYWNQRV